jgi:hypothetical protein
MGWGLEHGTVDRSGDRARRRRDHGGAQAHRARSARHSRGSGRCLTGAAPCRAPTIGIRWNRKRRERASPEVPKKRLGRVQSTRSPLRTISLIRAAIRRIRIPLSSLGHLCHVARPPEQRREVPTNLGTDSTETNGHRRIKRTGASLCSARAKELFGCAVVARDSPLTTHFRAVASNVPRPISRSPPPPPPLPRCA